MMNEWNESKDIQAIDDWVLKEFDKQCMDTYFLYAYIKSNSLDDYKYGVEQFIESQHELLGKLEDKVNKLE